MKELYDNLDAAVRSVESGVKRTDNAIEPLRKSAFRRFPTIFALLVGFGAGATFFGVERIITEFTWLNERPWLILGIGLLVLALTGRLHKKLE